MTGFYNNIVLKRFHYKKRLYIGITNYELNEWFSDGGNVIC